MKDVADKLDAAFIGGAAPTETVPGTPDPQTTRPASSTMQACRIRRCRCDRLRLTYRRMGQAAVGQREHRVGQVFHAPRNVCRATKVKQGTGSNQYLLTPDAT